MDTGEVTFGEVFQVNREFLSAHHFVTEDEAVHTLKKVIRSQLPDAIIYEHRLVGGAGR